MCLLPTSIANIRGEKNYRWAPFWQPSKKFNNFIVALSNFEGLPLHFYDVFKAAR
jgi:hypothetical protein